MQPRPSGAIIFDIEEELATTEMRLELNRCYNQCTALVRTHPRSEEQPENVVRLKAIGGADYLSSDASSQAYWDEVMQRWVESIFHNLSNGMMIFNRRQREINGQELKFEHCDLVLGKDELTVSVRLDSNCAIAPNAAHMVTLARNKYCSGAFGSGVERIQMPSEQDFARQAMQAVEQREIREAEKKRVEERAEKERLLRKQALEKEAEELFLASPGLEQAEDTDEQTMQERVELEERFSFPEADFAVSLDIWNLQYEDGSSRTYTVSNDNLA